MELLRNDTNPPTSPHTRIRDHVRHSNDGLNATATRNEGGGGKEREIRGKASVLDAYHQRELRSCNRSKKHPWAVKEVEVVGVKAAESKKYA